MKKYISLFLGPALFFIILASPLNFSSVEAKKLLAIFSWVIIWWLLEVFPLHITGILGVCLTVFMNVSTANNAFASFSNPIIFLFMGSFIISKAFQKYQLDQLFSQALLNSKWVQKKTNRIFLSLFCLTAFMSAWMSNSATTALMLPLAIGICSKVFEKNSPAQSFVLLGIAYSASIGGLLTPVGSPPNLIAIGFLDSIANIKINFLQWILYTSPIVFTSMYFLYRTIIKKISPSFKIGFHQPESTKRIFFNSDQKKIMGIMFFLVFFWVTPGALELSLGTTWTKVFQEGVVSIFFAMLLFLIPSSKSNSLLTWDEAKDIDWATLLLFGSGLALGNSLFQTKLTDDIASLIAITDPSFSFWLILILSITFIGIFFSEIASNTAAANILLPIVITFSLPHDQKINVLAVCYSLSLAFMLPVGTPPNAIVYGSGLVKSKDMIRLGFFMNIVSWLIISTVSIFLKLTF